jgi:hypothetical protein
MAPDRPSREEVESMSEAEDLRTIAEIAVGLAGFSAVIGVLGSRPSRSDLRVDALRLQVMLESGLMVAAYSLLPLLVARFGLATDAVWRISGALFLLCAIPSEFLALRRTRRMKDMKLAGFNVNSINWCLSFGADLLMLAIALGAFESRAGAIYLSAIFLLLVMAGILFVQFASSTFLPSEA